MNADNWQFTDLERTLRQFPPASLPADLERNLQAAAAGRARVPFADRLLACWTISGGMAACVVAACILWQLAGTPGKVPASSQEMALQQQTVQEIRTWLASR